MILGINTTPIIPGWITWNHVRKLVPLKYTVGLPLIDDQDKTGARPIPLCIRCQVFATLLDRCTIVEPEYVNPVDGSYHNLSQLVMGSLRNGCMTCQVIMIVPVAFAHSDHIVRYNVLSPNQLTPLLVGIIDEVLYRTHDNNVD
jgi:hypothetical protein